MLNKDEIWYVLCRLLHSICLFHTDQFTAKCTASCNCTLYINTHVVCCFPSSPLYSPIVKLFCTALVYTCFFFGGGDWATFSYMHCIVFKKGNPRVYADVSYYLQCSAFKKGTLECMLMYPTIYSVVHLRKGTLECMLMYSTIRSVMYLRKGTLECMLMYPTIYSVLYLRKGTLECMLMFPTIYSVLYLRKGTLECMLMYLTFYSGLYLRKGTLECMLMYPTSETGLIQILRRMGEENFALRLCFHVLNVLTSTSEINKFLFSISLAWQYRGRESDSNENA